MKEQILLEITVGIAIRILAIPAIVGTLITAIYNLVDTAFMVSPLLFQPPPFGFMVSVLPVDRPIGVHSRPAGRRPCAIVGSATAGIIILRFAPTCGGIVTPKRAACTAGGVTEAGITLP